MIEPQKPKQWELLAFVPIAVGLYWLLAQEGFWWLIWAVIPGGLLLATGVALLLMPGDHRIAALMGLGGIAGTLALPLAWIFGDLGTAFYGVVGALACLLVAGRVGLVREPLYTAAPAPELSTEMSFKAGLDEAMLGYFLCTARVPSGDEAQRMCDDALQLDRMLHERGWYADPASMHALPPPPEETFVERARLWGIDYEVLRFDSGFTPPLDLSGSYRHRAAGSSTRHDQCHVRILRHPGPPRPWLLCLHGYRMGAPWMDLSLFAPKWLHHHLGLNLIQPVLPLHGPRRAGLHSGDFFLDGDLLDLVHAEAQTLWDIRRTLAWLRAAEPQARIGVLGFSLGGYNAALLAAHERALDFVVAGIPLVDIAATLWRFLPRAHLQYFAAQGMDEAHYRKVLGVVSPLALKPLIEREHLHIFGAAGDRIVLPPHPLALSGHWEVPVQWYQGSHLSARREHTTRQTLRQALAGAGWAVE